MSQHQVSHQVSQQLMGGGLLDRGVSLKFDVNDPEMSFRKRCGDRHPRRASGSRASVRSSCACWDTEPLSRLPLSPAPPLPPLRSCAQARVVDAVETGQPGSAEISCAGKHDWFGR